MTELDTSISPINADIVDHHCFGCGDANPSGLRLRFRPHPNGGVWARFTPDRAHEGYLAMTHGGILATIADEAMSWAITHAGSIGVTARMSVAFRAPARVGDELLVVAEISKQRGRLIDAAATITGPDDTVVAEAEGRFMRVTAEQAAAWREGYGAVDDSSAFGRAVSNSSSA